MLCSPFCIVAVGSHYACIVVVMSDALIIDTRILQSVSQTDVVVTTMHQAVVRSMQCRYSPNQTLYRRFAYPRSWGT